VGEARERDEEQSQHREKRTGSRAGVKKDASFFRARRVGEPGGKIRSFFRVLFGRAYKTQEISTQFTEQE
jgi:hypothetical protein